MKSNSSLGREDADCLGGVSSVTWGAFPKLLSRTLVSAINLPPTRGPFSIFPLLCSFLKKQIPYVILPCQTADLLGCFVAHTSGVLGECTFPFIYSRSKSGVSTGQGLGGWSPWRFFQSPPSPNHNPACWSYQVHVQLISVQGIILCGPHFSKLEQKGLANSFCFQSSNFLGQIRPYVPSSLVL